MTKTEVKQANEVSQVSQESKATRLSNRPLRDRYAFKRSEVTGRLLLIEKPVTPAELLKPKIKRQEELARSHGWLIFVVALGLIAAAFSMRSHVGLFVAVLVVGVFCVPWYWLSFQPGLTEELAAFNEKFQLTPEHMLAKRLYTAESLEMLNSATLQNELFETYLTNIIWVFNNDYDSRCENRGWSFSSPRESLEDRLKDDGFRLVQVLQKEAE